MLSGLFMTKRIPVEEGIQPPGPVPDVWLRRVGEYELLNPGEPKFICITGAVVQVYVEAEAIVAIDTR